MFERVLRRMRFCVRSRRYVITVHADEELWADDLTVEDLERAIAAGRIVSRQRDATLSEYKYRVLGPTVSSGRMEVVARLSPTGRLVIITVYRVM